MVLDQQKSNKKPSGGKLRVINRKKKANLGRDPSLTKIGKKAVRTQRVRGGNRKLKLMRTETVNLLDQKTKKFSQAKLIKVVENPANRHFIRRNIVTKGTIIETDQGNAKVTSRPGQDGYVNAVKI